MPRPDPDRHHQLRRRLRSGGAQGGRVRRGAARRGRDRGPSSIESDPGAHVGRRALGRRATADAAAAARPPRRRTGRGGRLEGRPVLRRDRGRLRLGPRCGRHEGLRRDDPDRRPARASARARSRRGRSRSASPPTRRRAGTRARSRSSTTTPSGSRAAPRRSARSAASRATVRGQRIYLIETAEKGMAWLRLTRAAAGPATARWSTTTTPSPGSPRRSRGSARTSGRCGSRRPMEVLLGDRRRARRHRGHPGQRRGAGRASSAARPGCSAPSSATPPTRRCSGRLQGSTSSPADATRAHRRPLPAGLRGRVLRDAARAARRRHRARATSSTTRRRARRRSTATWSTR